MNTESHSPDSHPIGQALRTHPIAKIGELLGVFLAAFGLIALLRPWTQDSPLLLQGSVWLAYLLMLGLIWLGLRLRGENWEAFGLSFKRFTRKEAQHTFLLSLLVLVLGVAGFVLGSIIMTNITGIPEQADMSGYNYLKDNLGMLILALLGVYVASSFGEEVIYRGFLITRLEQLGLNSKWGIWVAVVISSIVFGLVHYAWGPMGMVQTGFMGLALGICYIKLNRRLWILILAHVYMDTILLVQQYLG